MHRMLRLNTGRQRKKTKTKKKVGFVGCERMEKKIDGNEREVEQRFFFKDKIPRFNSMKRNVDMKSRMFGRPGLITVLISMFCLYFLAFYFNLNIQNIPMLRRIISVDLYHRSIGNDTKTILFWNTMFGNETFYFGTGDVFRDCPVNDCYATHDRSFSDVADFDAILFHGNELDLRDLPRRRKVDQLYVYVNLESPENRPLPHYFYEDYFNLTMTYRLDSDLPWTYGVVRDRKNGQVVAPLRNTSWSVQEAAEEEEEDDPSLSSAIGGKRKPVSWFVSNCMAKSGRFEYVEELSRYVGVDVYGQCGDYSCPYTRNCLSEIVEPDYFFYLSFENSLCQDYVTEKLYKSLRYHVVPVVYGGANYSLFSPPHSYVNALDFDTPKDLAAYLHKLINNPSEYRRYFRWKRRYKIDSGVKRAICGLCKYLHESDETTVYNHLSNWYSEKKCPLQKFLGDQKYASRMTLKRAKN